VALGRSGNPLRLSKAQLIVRRISRPAGHAVAASKLLHANGWLAAGESRKLFRSRETPTKGSKMPKMKTKSGVKKRFKITGTGKVMAAQAGKRHGMIKRTAKFIRNARGKFVLEDGDARIIKKMSPYGLD
jgi:large subunit ribosomal protein L35